MDRCVGLLALPVDMLRHVATELSTPDVLSFGAICQEMVRRLDQAGACADVYRRIGDAVDGEGTVEPNALAAVLEKIASLPFGLRPSLLRAVTLRAASLPNYHSGQSYRQFWWMRNRWYDALRAPPSMPQQRAIDVWARCVEDTNRRLLDDASRLVRETGLRDLLMAEIYAPLLKVDTFLGKWLGPISSVAAGLPIRYRLAVMDCVLTIHPSSDVPRALLDVDAMFDGCLLCASTDELPIHVSGSRTRSLSAMPPRLLFNLIDTLMASSPNVDLRTRCLTRLHIDEPYLREHVDPYVAKWIAEQGLFLADAGASPTGTCPYPWSETLEQQLIKWHAGYDNAFGRCIHEGFLDAVVAQASWGHAPAVAALSEPVRQFLRDRVLSVPATVVYALGAERDIVPAFWSLYVQLEHQDMPFDAMTGWESIMQLPWQLHAVLVERWARRMSAYVVDPRYAGAYVAHADTVLLDCLWWEQSLSARCREHGLPALAVRVMTASLTIQCAVAQCRETVLRTNVQGTSDVGCRPHFNPVFSALGRANVDALPVSEQIAFLAALHVTKAGAGMHVNTGNASQAPGWEAYLRAGLERILADPGCRLIRPSQAVMAFLCERLPDAWDALADSNDADATRLDRLLERLGLSCEMRTRFRRRLLQTLGMRVAMGDLTMPQAIASLAAPGDVATRRALLAVIQEHAP